MRTSLNEIRLIDGHLFNQLSGEDSALFNARLILNSEFSEQVAWQEKTHAVINQYSRKKLKAEIEAVHTKLFKEAKHQTFRQKILGLFK